MRLNHKGQPRLCSLVGATLYVLTRAGLCFPSSIAALSIEVEADSNRAVLQGKFNVISIEVQDSNSKLLQIQKANLQASQLNLRWSPTLLGAALPALLMQPRLFLKFVLYFSIWKIYGDYLTDYLRNKTQVPTLYRKHIRPSLQPVFGKFKKYLIPEPCIFNYKLSITNDNLQHSLLLRKFSQSVLDSLMKNSVLKAAAAVGDVFNTRRLQGSQTASQYSQDFSNGSTLKDTEGIVKFNVPVDSSVEAQNDFQLTQLLSATSFEIREPPMFTDDGRWVLPGFAVLPRDGGRLDFVLRTTILAKNPTWMNDNSTKELERRHGIGFESPECRFNVNAAASKIPNALGKFLPSVLWIPVGPGVFLPLGRSNRVQKVIVTGNKCRIEGSYVLWDEEKEASAVQKIG